jgi:outer membrane protein assembly factor BamB
MALVAVSGAVKAGDQAMFRGDPAHTGTYASVPASLATVRWTFHTGARIISSPAVSDGTVYFGSGDHSLYAVDAADGKLRWSYKAPAAVHSSPAVSGNVVLFGSLDGAIRGLDRITGKLLWTYKTGGERRFSAPGIHGAMPSTEVMPDPFDVFLSSPAISGGIAYIGSGDQHVYALDVATGALRWKTRTGNVVHASPAVANGVVYIGSFDRKFYALTAATGAIIWTFETGDDRQIYNQVGIASSAAVDEGRVFFGCRDGYFYALDATTGSLLWKHDNHKGWVIASPALAGGNVYFPTSDGQRLKALEARTGRVVFDRAMAAISFCSPAIAGKSLIFGTSDGCLQAVDLDTGRLTASFQTEGNRRNGGKYLDASGQIKSAELYPDFTLDGMIIGLDRMFSLGSILSSPVLADGVVYVGSTDGNLYALR